MKTCYENVYSDSAKTAQILHKQIDNDLSFMSNSTADKVIQESEEYWLYHSNHSVHDAINTGTFRHVAWTMIKSNVFV